MEAVSPALIGKAGEMLVAAELMRRGIEVAHPASDVGVDLLAYRLKTKQTVATKFIPIQVKARSETGYHFQRSWFDRCPGITLVHVWYVRVTSEFPAPQFYVFSSLNDVEDALGTHALSPSWIDDGIWTETSATKGAVDRMQHHRDKWERIMEQLP